MKIAIISTMLGQAWTGSEELWADMAAEALQEGHEVALFLWRWPSTPPRVLELQAQGAQIEFRKRPGRFPTVNGIINRLAGDRVSIPRPQRLSTYYALSRFNPDVICHSQGWPYEFRDSPDLTARIYASDTPLVVVNQANMEGAISESMRHDAIKYFGRATNVAFVAQGNLKVAERQLAIHLPQGIVIRNPVNMADLNMVAWPVRAKDETWNFACVGRLDCGHKGQDILLEALSAPVWRERPWRLRLFGAGPEKGYIDALIKHYNLSKRVEFGGHVPNVRDIWANHHLMVMPSRVEGTPLALVEAMLCGRAAVVTDVGGYPEWIEEGETGFIAPAPSAPSVSAALELAWQNRDRWKAMGSAAHDAACRRYDPTPGRTLLQILQTATNPTTSHSEVIQ